MEQASEDMEQAADIISHQNFPVWLSGLHVKLSRKQNCYDQLVANHFVPLQNGLGFSRCQQVLTAQRQHPGSPHE